MPSGKVSYLQEMANTPLLSALNENELELLSKGSIVKRLDRKQILFSETDSVEGFFLVLSGIVKIYKLSLSGKEHVLHLAYPGQTFAEASLFAFDSYPANAEAVEDSKLLMFPKNIFLKLLEEDPKLSLRLFRSMAIWLRRMADIISSLAFKDVKHRLISYFRQLSFHQHNSFETGLVIDIDLEKSLLAAYLGTIPETFSRALRKLQDEGLITVNGSRIVIVDADALEAALEDE